MTERHGDGRGDLGNDVQRQHHRNGLQIALRIAADAVGLDLVVGDDHKHHKRPAQQRGKILRRREQQHQRGQAAHGGQADQRRDKRREAQPLGAHVLRHHVVDGLDQVFRNDLPLAGGMHLQIARQKPAQEADHRHADPHADDGLGQHRPAQRGNVDQNLCAGNIYVTHWVYPSFLKTCSGITVALRRCSNAAAPVRSPPPPS